MTGPFALRPEDMAGAINPMANPAAGMALSAALDQVGFGSTRMITANVPGALFADINISGGVAVRDLFLAYETAKSAGGK